MRPPERARRPSGGPPGGCLMEWSRMRVQKNYSPISCPSCEPSRDATSPRRVRGQDRHALRELSLSHFHTSRARLNLAEGLASLERTTSRRRRPRAFRNLVAERTCGIVDLGCGVVDTTKY
jgi:hypothetical protein